MKIIGIVCSPRKAGNTEIPVAEALNAAREKGAETEMVLLADKKISPCEACLGCVADGVCVIEEDMQDVYQKLENADGIIFGTPVYFNNVSAQAKAVINRTYAFLWTSKLRGKVAGAAVAVRRVGAGQVKNDQSLLACNNQTRISSFSVLAGFVEPSETLEECVRREVKKEVGIIVENIQYSGSQPWSFPNSLVIGFTTEYAAGEIQIDSEQLSDAGLFERASPPRSLPRL